MYYGIPAISYKLTKMKKVKIPNEIKTDSLLRGTTSNYIRLISDADRKARIMIVVNSILLTISATLLTKTVHQGPPTWISLILLIVSNLLSLFFTFISIKPEIHVRIKKDTEDNILHYEKCSEYSVRDYMVHMMKIIFYVNRWLGDQRQIRNLFIVIQKQLLNGWRKTPTTTHGVLFTENPQWIRNKF